MMYSNLCLTCRETLPLINLKYANIKQITGKFIFKRVETFTYVTQYFDLHYVPNYEQSTINCPLGEIKARKYNVKMYFFSLR